MQSLYSVDLPTLEQVIEFSPVNVLPDTLLIDAIACMNPRSSNTSNCSSCILIVKEKKLLGILTLRDVVRLIGERVDLSQVKISEVMTQPVISLTFALAENALTALSVMRQHRIRHLPVVDDLEQLLGLITQDRICQLLEPVQQELELLVAEPTAEEKSRQIAELDAFRVALSDALRSLNSPHEIQSVACRILGEYLQVDRVYYIKIEPGDEYLVIPHDYYSNGRVPSIAGRYRIRDFGTYVFQEMQANRTLVIADTQTITADSEAERAAYNNIFVRAFIIHPFLKAGKLAAVLGVTQSTPRLWTEAEVTLVQETAERTWAAVERARAEAALRESEQRLKLALSASNTGTWDWNLQTNELIWSESMSSLFDIDPQAFEGKLSSFFNFVHPEDREFVEQSLMQAIDEQGICDIEFRIVWCDGTVRWANGKGKVFCDNTSQPLRIIGVHQDITERKQTEQIFRNIAAGVSATTGQTFFHSLVQYLASALQVDYAFVGILANESAPHIKTIAVFGNGAVVENIEYDLANTPCLKVITQKTCVYTNNVQQEFPQDILLAELNIASYAGSPIFDSTGSILGLIAVLHRQKLTQPQLVVSVLQTFAARAAAEVERQQTEANLQQSERKLRSVFDSSFQFMGLLTKEGILLDANRASLNVIAADLSDLIGKPFWETPWWIHFPEQQLKVREAVARAANGEFVRMETKHIWADGTLAFVDSSLKPMFDEVGNVVMLVPEGRDITARKLAEQKIQEQAALINIATDAIFVRDLEKCILFWSRGAERLYGWTAEESLGKKVDDLVCKGTSSQLAIGLQETLEKGSWQGEVEQITKNGRKIIVSSRWSLIENQFGQPQTILVVNTDITEKKQLEAQFYRAQRLESIGTLASGIAHDLNNVFAPIMMIAQLLPSRCPNVSEQTKELFKTLETSSKRGADLVRQILTFARGTEGKSIILQVGHLLNELVNVLKQTFPKSIEIVKNIPADTLWMLQADPTQLEQVFMNLAVNARDAMPNGGKLTITAENRTIDETYARMHLEAKAGSYVVVSVLDTGIGIPPEFLERIFDPFFTTKEVGKGTGLGLSTVLGIVKNYGGFVEVSSKVGKGTKFQVFLRRGEGTGSEIITKAELPRGNGELILVVDDEAIVQQTTQETLADYNYKTLMASDGIEAIALYAERQQEISAVLLDMVMPNMDGLTAIRILQTINPHVKIIATSGLPTNEPKALAVGVAKFLFKPYTARDLLHTLADAINIIRNS